jgi:hypothetical protein
MKAHLYFDSEIEGGNVRTYEIDIPEGANTLLYYLNVTPVHQDAFIIPIPRSKVKVKKWLWVCGFLHHDPILTSIEYKDADSLYNRYGKMEWCRRIDETEIEVEE